MRDLFLVSPRLRIRVSIFALPFFLIMLYNEGLIAFSVMLFSAVLHEFGHILAIKYFGFRVRRVDVLPMGAVIVCPEGMPYKTEILVALAGPAVSLFLAVLSAAFYAAFGSVYMLFSVLINFLFCFANLLPLKKSDGGKAFGCYLLLKKEKETAKRLSSAVSMVFMFLFCAFTVFVLPLSNYNLGLILSLFSVALMAI